MPHRLQQDQNEELELFSFEEANFENLKNLEQLVTQQQNIELVQHQEISQKVKLTDFTTDKDLFVGFILFQIPLTEKCINQSTLFNQFNSIGFDLTQYFVYIWNGQIFQFQSLISEIPIQIFKQIDVIHLKIQKKEMKNYQGVNLNSIKLNNNNVTPKIQKRPKERTIQQAIDLVTLWKTNNKNFKNQKFDQQIFQGSQIQKMTLDISAKIIGVSRKTLDDYSQQLKKGQTYGFDFNNNKFKGFGVLRNFNKQSKQSSALKNLQIINQEQGQSNFEFNFDDLEDYQFQEQTSQQKQTQIMNQDQKLIPSKQEVNLINFQEQETNNEFYVDHAQQQQQFELEKLIIFKGNNNNDKNKNECLEQHQQDQQYSENIHLGEENFYLENYIEHNTSNNLDPNNHTDINENLLFLKNYSYHYPLNNIDQNNGEIFSEIKKYQLSNNSNFQSEYKKLQSNYFQINYSDVSNQEYLFNKF